MVLTTTPLSPHGVVGGSDDETLPRTFPARFPLNVVVHNARHSCREIDHKKTQLFEQARYRDMPRSIKRRVGRTMTGNFVCTVDSVLVTTGGAQLRTKDRLPNIGQRERKRTYEKRVALAYYVYGNEKREKGDGKDRFEGRFWTCRG